MNQVIANKPPGWFRVVAVLALLWNLLGVFQYLANVGVFGDPMAGLDEAQRQLAQSVPGWVTGAFALAVFAGLLGSVGLVMLKRWARLLLIVSLIALLAQCGWILFLSDAGTVEGMAGFAIPILLLVIGILLVWLSDLGIRRAWLT